MQNNWRQVHWLTQKVRCDDDAIMSIEHLLGHFSTLWKVEQQKWDRYLDNESYCWTDEVCLYLLVYAFMMEFIFDRCRYQNVNSIFVK